MRKDVVVLASQKQWKAVSHPLRHQIVRLLARGELTNEELATKIGVPSGQLHYHTKKLLDAGLIELAGTRRKGPLTEKLYRKVGTSFVVQPVEDGSAPPLSAFIENALEGYRTTWEAANGETFPQQAYHLFRYLMPEDETKVYQRIRELVEFLDQVSVPLDTAGCHLVSIATLVHRMQAEENAAPDSNSN